MLSASHRLSTAADFRQVVRLGRRAGGPLVVVHVMTANVDKAISRLGAPESSRVGFVVSKAVGPAVVRNRVKRRLRHLMRERVGGLVDGTLVVVRAMPTSARATYGELGIELDRCLRRVTS